MAYNKVEANGQTLIDLTSDTVTADTLVSGRTAHLASGERVTGTFEPVTGVKGNAETAYRTGNVNLTPANIGAATSAQGTKADSAVQTIKMNGSTVTKINEVVNLGTVIKAHQDISGKADKSATVSNVTYDTTNKKLTKTINGTTSDVVTTAQLKTDMALSKSDVGLNNVDNTSDANKPISTATQAEFDKQQAQIDKALEQTGYNLLEITADTQTINGVTFIVDKAAGTITANGTASQGIWANVSYGKLSAGNYILSGCPTSSFDKFSLALYENIPSSPFIVYNAGNNTMFTLPNAKNYKLQIRITAGTTLSYVVFKPMIVPVELAGVPFQPYAKSNAELTRYTDYVEISQDEDNHTDIISIGATKQLDIVHSDYFLQNKIILKEPNVYLPGSAEIVTRGQQAEISLATGAAEVKLVANTDSSNTPYLYLQSGVIPYISIQPNSNKMQFITDANGTQKIAIDTNGVHIVSGGTVFEVKSDGVYINGTKIGG